MNNKFRKTVLSGAVLSASLTGGTAPVLAQAPALEEVIVTATRRDASVQDVPYNISALTGNDLAKAGVNSTADLFRIANGVNFVETGPRSGVNNSNVMIRGINAEDLTRISGPMSTAPVVSVYINETPVFANLRLKDIDRVEILRGPQGTLYGSGSLGGSVRYIYNKPDFSEFGGEVSGGVSQTENGDGINYETDLMLNIPLGDTFGVRINAGYLDYSGFIDQPNRYVRRSDGSPELDNGSTDPFGDSANFFAGQPVFKKFDGVNDTETTSARIAATWAPTDRFEATASYHYQDDDSGGTQMNSYELYGDDSTDNAALIEEPFDREVDIAALEVDYDMGFASFTASASTYQSEGDGSRDLTGFYENGLVFYESAYGTSPRPLVEDKSAFNDEGDVFEARLVSQGDNLFDWVVGLYYMDQDTELSVNQFFYGYDDYANSCFIETDTFGGAPCGFGTLFGLEETNGPLPIVKDEVYVVYQDNNFEDFAAFGELTWNITDRWQVTGGVRYYDQEFETSQVGGLPFIPDAVDSRALDNSDSDSLFKFNTAYQLNDNTNLYAVWSEGFRRGGANGLPSSTVFGTEVNPKAFLYENDTTENIEIGIKGTLFDTYQYSVAYYDVDWEDMQANLSCTDLALLCVINVGDASSQGVEAEFNGYITDNIDVIFSYTYNDSELDSLSNNLREFTADGTIFAAVQEGASLPGASDHVMYMGANYHQQLSNGMEVVYSVNGSFRDSAETSLDELSVQVDSFWLWNAGITLNAEHWDVRAFINNIDDERGLLGADSTVLWGPRANAVISTPRTFGLSASYRF
jgi:outer membrane receptor protein involved in Fe transport